LFYKPEKRKGEYDEKPTRDNGCQGKKATGRDKAFFIPLGARG